MRSARRSTAGVSQHLSDDACAAPRPAQVRCWGDRGVHERRLAARPGRGQRLLVQHCPGGLWRVGLSGTAMDG
jgi:hypothetical protein